MNKSLRNASILIFTALFSYNLDISHVKAENKNHVTQEVGKGVIDWTDKIIKVTGSGAIPTDKPLGQARLLGERAAISDAYRQMAEIVYGVRVDSETIVRDFITESDLIKTKVEGFIKGAKRGEKKLNPDGTIEYELYAPLYGQSGLADVIDLDKHIKKRQKISFNLKKFHKSFAFNFNNHNNDFFKIANLPDNQNNSCLECHIPHSITDEMKNKSNSNIIPTESIENKVTGKITGVIIDAQGLGLVPAMDPAVFDSDLKRLYIGNWEIDADFVVNNGIIGYFSDLESAKKDLSRIGNNPIIIKANSAKSVTDLILENESANILNSSETNNKFLEKYAVDVVM